jgi:hypothetical protein
VLDGSDPVYSRDATETRGIEGRADAVVFPQTTEQVAQVLAWCYEHDVPLTPRGGGSGFAGGAVPVQGGVVLALGPLALFLAGRYMRMKVVAPHALIEIGDSLGAAGYGLIGLGGLVFAGIFFKNFITPFGIPGHLLSAGQMPLASIAVGLEVSGAFLVGWTEFLDQAMLVQRGQH